MVSQAQDDSASSAEWQNKHRKKREKSETPIFQDIRRNLHIYACQVGVIMTLMYFIIVLVIETEAVMTTIVRFILME